VSEGRPSRRVRLDLAYDGTEFEGWQRQARGRTVQGELEAALARIQGGERTVVHGAGRTDAGVHARRQVAHVDLRTAVDDGRLLHALRGLLEADLRPLALRAVDPGFDARRDAVAKHYRYRLDRSAHGDPFARRYALHWPWPLDLGAMREGLGRLVGRHDFGGFAATSCEAVDRVRTVSAAELVEGDGENLWFRFSGPGFLTHMIRIMVGTLLDIGRGRFEPALIDRILAGGDRTLAGPTAPAHGLVLWEIVYPDAGGSN